MSADGDINTEASYNGTVSVDVHYPVIELYIAVSLRLVLATAIFIAAGLVALTIRRSNRISESLHLFFIAHLMIADVGVAVIQNGVPIANILMTIINPDTEGIDCRILGATSFPNTASSLMLAVVCFDRLYAIVAHKHYKNDKKRGYVAVITVWMVSILASSSCLGHPYSNPNKSKIGYCSDNYFEYFEFGIAMLSLAFADCFALVQGIFLYHKCVLDVKEMILYGSTDLLHSGLRRAWSKFRETQKASVTLLIIASSSTILGIVIPTIIEAVQPHIGGVARAVLLSLVYCTVTNANILLHAVFYGIFLHSIHEVIGFNVRSWICSMSRYCCFCWYIWKRQNTQHYID